MTIFTAIKHKDKYCITQIDFFAILKYFSLELSDVCRKNKTSVIVADSAGLAGRVFCDFGEEFTVFDKDGTEPKSVLISSVVRDGDDMLVTCHDEVRHELETGDYVKFTELQGLD